LLCAHKGGFFADMFQAPLTTKYVLSHGEMCDADFMHDVLITLSQSAKGTDLEQCGRQDNGTCTKNINFDQLCGCKSNTAFRNPSSCGMCPCRMYRLLYLSTVVGTILNNHGLPFFLMDGMLLGALRYGGLMPHDYDGDWGVYVNDKTSLERLWKAIKEINDHLHKQKGPLSGEVGFGNRSWDDMQMNGGKKSMFWVVLRGGIHVDHLDLAIVVPSQVNPKELVILQDPPLKISRLNVFPLINCEFHGGAWPCARRSQVLAAKLYPNSLAHHNGDPSDIKQVLESLDCLDSSGRPSLSVCGAKAGNKLNENCSEFSAEAVHQYVSGSMPTSDLEHLVGLSV